MLGAVVGVVVVGLVLSGCSQSGQCAIESARAAVGLPGAKASVSRVPAQDVQVPFLGDQLAGQQVWKVVLDHQPGRDDKAGWCSDTGVGAG